jgi:hypothetical protein
VLLAEGFDPKLSLKQDRRPMLEIVNTWAVYGGDYEQGSVTGRPRFPSDC